MVRSGAEWLLWLLLALSLGSLAVAFDRLWAMRRVAGTWRPWPRPFGGACGAASPRRLTSFSTKRAARPSRVVTAGPCEAELGPAAAEEAMAAAIGLERGRLEKRLLFLGTVGNNAPFVGLLGTVIGVVGAFSALGKSQAMANTVGAAAGLAPGRVMGTIAEALVATAVGLLVAIPAVAV